MYVLSFKVKLTFLMASTETVMFVLLQDPNNNCYDYLSHINAMLEAIYKRSLDEGVYNIREKENNL